LIKVGLIVAAHGIRGEVKIRSFIQPPEVVFACGALSNASGKRQFTIHKRGGNEKAFIASVEGIADRNAAEMLKGTELYAPVEALPKDNPDDYYAEELIGLEARVASGTPYGRITQCYNFGAGDIIEIALANGKTEMLPLGKPFVNEISPERGYVIVSPPEYVEGKE
jgi:16S rRNA processing protein RimM